MNANMEVSEQCRIAASKGNQVLGMIRRNITCPINNGPYLRKDIDMCNMCSPGTI